MKKKLVGILMGVAMTATTIAAPTAIFADDIDIEDIAVETEEDDVADVEVEDEAEPAEEVTAEDDFSAEADDAECLFTDAEDAGLTVEDLENPVSASVIASAQNADNSYIYHPTPTTVLSNAAERAGYTDLIGVSEGVSVLDVLVTMHSNLYSDFDKATAANYIELFYQTEKKPVNGAWINKMFGQESRYSGCFAVNGLTPYYDPSEIDMFDKNNYSGRFANDTVVKDDDTVDFFFCQDTMSYSDMYSYFSKGQTAFCGKFEANAGESCTLNLKSFCYKMYGASIESWRNTFIQNAVDMEFGIYMRSGDTKADAAADAVDSFALTPIDGGVSENGQISFNAPADPGTYLVIATPSDSSGLRYTSAHFELVVK